MSDSTFETRDLYFAAYLNLHLEMVGTREEKEWSRKRKKETRILYFVFKINSSVTELKSRFFSGRGMVSALAYADSVKNLKTLLHL